MEKSVQETRAQLLVDMKNLRRSVAKAVAMKTKHQKESCMTEEITNKPAGVAAVTAITLEDHGQDFLEWDLDEENVVVECRPFQAWAWEGIKVLNESITPGDFLEVELADGSRATLKYPVATVKTNQVQEAL